MDKEIEDLKVILSNIRYEVLAASDRCEGTDSWQEQETEHHNIRKQMDKLNDIILKCPNFVQKS